VNILNKLNLNLRVETCILSKYIYLANELAFLYSPYVHSYEIEINV